LIASGKHQEQAGIVNRMLAIKPVVAIGLISYALYLWHWPILALINYQGIELTKPVASLAIGASITMAVLSYFFI
jgi:peptidoglycan/LPS O-acetylase OafA/YrhL